MSPLIEGTISGVSSAAFLCPIFAGLTPEVAVVRDTFTLLTKMFRLITGRRLTPFVLMLVLLPIVLAACGGGGGNDETPTPTAKPLPRTPTVIPTATASPIAS